MKKVLNEWGRFLKVDLLADLNSATRIPSITSFIYPLTSMKSPQSATVLTTETTGWFSPHGKKDLMEVANAPLKTNHSFEDMYICDPKAKHHGYTSWDGKLLCFPPFPFSPPQKPKLSLTISSRLFSTLLYSTLSPTLTHPQTFSPGNSAPTYAPSHPPQTTP